MKKIITVAVALFFVQSYAQKKVDLSYYLPSNISYNKAIPTPESVIGFQVGKWHVSHDKLVQYMQALAKSSDRVTIENRGTTYEGRPLLLLTITSPKNHQNLDKIKEDHVSLTNPVVSQQLDVKNMPLVVYQGYSIHGNEASGANAGLLIAYYLAAAQGDYIDNLLDKTIILFDPSYNPDGLQRFSTWVNMHKSQHIVTDSNDREYSEAWPGGRTNHYWFDMNRDWLVTQLPESKVRIKTYQSWYPNILTDHHEMGTNGTYFFQPGIQSRTHPLTPKLNQVLTKKIATYHAKAMDKIGSLYYSEESFDDFYYGKGSTYPDINGGIGILFEQASARGHAQETDNGILTFPFAIKNHITTALSTLDAGLHLHDDILNYQRRFYINARNEARRSKQKAIYIGSDKDPYKLYQFGKMLERQHIRYNALKQSITLNGKRFNKTTSFAIPLEQKNYRMINAMFEKRTHFKDSLFYDVSAWTLPLAFNLNYTYTTSTSNVGAIMSDMSFKKGALSTKSNYAYIFEWHNYLAPHVLQSVLRKGLRAKVALKPFSLNGKTFDYGSIMIPVQNQKMNAEEIAGFLKNTASRTGVNITAENTGLTEGIDLGSPNFRPLKAAKVAVLVGNGIASYDAGEIWHLFDTRYHMRITKLDANNLKNYDLSKYTSIIVPSTYGDLPKTAATALKDFAKNGGVLIGYRNAVKWMAKTGLIKLDFKKSKPLTKNVTFEQRRNFKGAQVIGGAIFDTKLDLSHPINFGYTNKHLALFRNTTVFVKPDTTNYVNPIQYTQHPLLSGYISKENLKTMANTIPFKVSKLGKGRVIVFTDNTNFRAFWYGTNKLLMNAIFFGKMM
jgi:Zinc carboxypeptidase